MGNMVALMKVTFHALIRKILVSMATESWKIRNFLEFGYHGNKIERFLFIPKITVNERF